MQNQKGNISVIVSFIIVIGLVVFVIYMLLNKTNTPNPIDLNSIKIDSSIVGDTENVVKGDQITLKEEQNTTSNKMESNKRLLNNFKPVSIISKLEKIDTVVGTGTEVKAGATVSVHYTGAVAKTGEIFQSSKDFGDQSVTFPLDRVIKGWTDGIPGMKVGGTRRLLIPASMAYGSTPPPGSGIPADADLVFDVELVSIK